MDKAYFNELVMFLKDQLDWLEYHVYHMRQLLSRMEQDNNPDLSAEFAEALYDSQESYNEFFREYSRILREGTEKQINIVWSIHTRAHELQKRALCLDMSLSCHREWRVRRMSWLHKLMYNVLS